MAITTKEAKKFLQGFQRATLELESLNEEHERIISMLCSLTSDPSKSGGGSSGPSDNVGNGVVALMENCKKIDSEIKHYIATRDNVRAVIRSVMYHNIVWGQSLHHRYINWDRPAVVALEMGYDERWERRIHNNALEYVARLLEESGYDPAETRPKKPVISMI